ncbi:MAG: hypothetical protein ACW98G_18060, partial [Candidatus Hodarchaeales archaeon]
MKNILPLIIQYLNNGGLIFLPNSRSSFITSRKDILTIFFVFFLLFLPLLMIGQGYEYRKGYLKYKDSIGLVTFSQSIQTVNLSGKLTEVCAQLWLASDQFPPPANTSLFPSRASSDTTIRDWYWNTLFSDFFAQDVDQLLINDFPAISLMIWPAELNQEISSAFFIDYEQDPRVISPFDPSVSGFAFQVSYLPWDIELVSKDP